MSDTYIIEVCSQAAGIVVRDPGGYRFFAASHRFNRLEGQLFRNAREAERAARRARATGCRWRPDRQRRSSWLARSELGRARDSSFQSVALLLPVHQDVQVLRRLLAVGLNSCSPTKLKRTIAAGPTTRIVGSLYSSDVHL